MNYAETSIFFDQNTVFESEDAAVYGQKVAEVALRGGWMSPNYMYGKHWARVKKVRDALDQQIKNHILQLPVKEREVAVLRYPAARVLRVTIHQTRGPFPDVDNLLGGLKHTIDALRRVKYRHCMVNDKRKVERTESGNGLIWDDAPKWLRIAELFVCRRQGRGRDPCPGSYVILEIFSWPEEENG